MHEVERQYNITQANCKSKNESYQSLQRALDHVNGHQSPSLQPKQINRNISTIAYDCWN